MRIGEVNKDNYKFFLQMLGAKSSKALDALFGEDGDGNGKKTKELSIEERNQEYIRLGYAMEGMIINDGDDTSKWHKIIPVSDEVKDKLIDAVRNQFLRNGNGMSKPVVDSTEIGDINKAYLKNLTPNERLSATWTLAQIEINETQRLMDYVKKIDPTWTAGKPFDKNILLNSNFGTNTVDVKA